MSELPPAPYPDGTPDDWGDVLAQGERGAGIYSKFSNGDYVFYTGVWQTIHGLATVVRSDRGAFRVWGALLPDGRRVHCRRGWRRRSDDGRSWVIGKVKFEEQEVYFTDAESQRIPIELNANVFERAMAAQPRFLEQLRDDSFAFTLNDHLRVIGANLCTLDDSATWRDDVSATIARLRGFGEDGEDDFGYRGPWPNPPRTKGTIIAKALADAGWRYEDKFAWLGQDENA